MSEAHTPEYETLSQPDIEGVRVVGWVNPSSISALPATTPGEGGKAVYVQPGENIPEGFDCLTSHVQVMSTRYPEEPVNISVTRTTFSSGDEDPFEAQFLAASMDEPPEDPVHKDVESGLIRLACDMNPTVFYPKDSNGQAEMSNPWRPKPGEVVEFGPDVWHSPPLHVDDSGTRTLVTLRTGFIEPDDY